MIKIVVLEKMEKVLSWDFVIVDSLELWYNTILVLLTGNMKDAEVSIDALSIW